MPFPLHKAPKGLLELFRLRTLGAQPPQFGEQVTPTVDVTDFYGADLELIQADNGAAQVISQTLQAAPATEARRYLGISATLIVGAAAGTWLNVGVGFSAVTGGTPVLVAVENIATPIAGAIYRVAGHMGAPLLLPPQWFPVAVSLGDAAGADHVLELRTLFQQLDVRNQ